MTTTVAVTGTASQEEANRRLAQVYGLLIDLGRRRNATGAGTVGSQTTPVAIDAALEEHDAKGVSA